MQLVRATIARHVGRPAKDLDPSLRLTDDLELTPLELVLIATDIEDAIGMQMPVEGLASVHTVADLMRFFHRVFRLTRRFELD
jgi:acyl carrier protein